MAGQSFHFPAIHDAQAAAPVADDARPLQAHRDFGDSLSASAEHPRDQGMSIRERIRRMRPVGRGKKPPTHALGHIVMSVAYCILRAEAKAVGGEALQEAFRPMMSGYLRAELPGGNAREFTASLLHDLL